MRKLLFLLLFLVLAAAAEAKLRLPEILGSSMVLQQNSEVTLWGWADANAKVAVKPSWGGKYAVTSDDKGLWIVKIKTPAGSYAKHSIALASADKVTLDDVLIGEVWFASGQSNMEMPLRGFTSCPTEGSNDVILNAASKSGKIRFVKIPRTLHPEPQDVVAGKWNDFTPETAPGCTGTGYFFAERLNAVLDVPVGIIDCSWGGSRVESWISREILSTYPDVDLSAVGMAAFNDMHRPMTKYNAMVNPLVRYTIRGFIWYQGESNVGSYKTYAERLAHMVELWRGKWGLGELPFYFVEIAPYDSYGGTRDKGAYLREEQNRAQTLIPSSGMVSTNDLVEPYEATNIHPKNKRDVGGRLALWALSKTYGVKGVACENMQFEAMEIADGKARLTFRNAKDGFSRTADIRGFEICGPDSVFRAARARVERNKMIVWSDEVAEPVAVRYGFRDYLPGNVATLRGLPLVPFRTDNF